ncbi:hypothetical protein [Weissella confusa]|jgi:hypothetical protein|uniref:Uncharacterized protein n=1 Tax=Weissella confusa TaxID=1583 RepID=A0AA40YRW3_WEICO|nr:hypothetical protein [Weissella confusa]COJ63773.1 Uncharacterised protein [Streptococcus pneumoniae]KRN21826.1 hypothetical protein IV69_GL000575 [Weissella confusa]MBF7059109.1 hypothetical protein [Weissella confusa]MBJ7616614.1 hypothetical protein [Weissella confusa]MBJ7618897.1 hypothetical protein [Weissella confusa]
MEKKNLKLGMTILAVLLFLVAIVVMFVTHSKEVTSGLVFIGLVIGYYAAKVK